MTQHYFSKKPTSQLHKKTFKYTFKELRFEFASASGVFSKDYIDRGTEILLENVRISKNGHVLDMGCGYGIIGICLKKTNPGITVVSSDVNERAVKLATKNARNNKVVITTVLSNLYENIPQTFDIVIINLPTHAGKELCFAMIEQSFQHLNSTGSLQVVGRHQKGGRSFEEKMQEIFGNVTAIAKESGFRVYMSTKN